MRTEPESIEGTLISHEVTMDELKQRDFVLCKFYHGNIALCIAYKDKMITVAGGYGIRDLVKEGVATNSIGFAVPDETRIEKMWLVHIDDDDVMWRMFNFLDKRAGGVLGTPPED